MAKFLYNIFVIILLQTVFLLCENSNYEKLTLALDNFNPDCSSNLFLLPEGTQPLGNKPYIEASIGLENIFKILRIEDYRRLNYPDEPDIKKEGSKVAFRFSF